MCSSSALLSCLLLALNLGGIRTLDSFRRPAAQTHLVYLPWGCSAQEQLVPRFRDVLQTGPEVHPEQSHVSVIDQQIL